jgi:uncharacterized protein (TIGR01777 family)
MEHSFIIIAGGTGLIGQRLSDYLFMKGYVVGVLSRNPVKKDHYYWDPSKQLIDESILHRITHLINLSGQSIGDKRWSKSRKKELVASRVDPTRFLASLKPKMNNLRHYITASGVSCYGFDSPTHAYSETDVFGNDFLSTIVAKWEEEADVFKSNCLVTKLRISPVIDRKGGFLDKISKPIKHGFGAPIGSGQQWIPWIHWLDLVRIFEFILKEKKEGVFNAVAGNDTNHDFTMELARILHKKIILPNTPAFLIKLILGEMATLVLDGVQISNEKLVREGFDFKYPTLSAGLEETLII